VPPPAQDDFSTDLGIALQTIQSAVVPQRAHAQDNTWDIWEDFCMEHGVDSLLNQAADPIHFLLVFAVRYGDGRLAKEGNPVQSQTEEDAVCAVGQTIA
jgi:hypothetical protein